jgi:hypothetical protein
MKELLPAIFGTLLMIACEHKKDLSEQLNDSFANHLKRIDSLAVLDSIRILWNVPITEKLGRIIDDTIYKREFRRVQSQLLSAEQKNDKDSIEFYKYEIDYMEKPIDSLTKSIARGDTTRKFGYMMGVAYYIRKQQKTKIDSTIVIIDSVSAMRYTEFMDSAIRRTIKDLN